jgi:GTP cyclohydrolase I
MENKSKLAWVRRRSVARPQRQDVRFEELSIEAPRTAVGEEEEATIKESVAPVGSSQEDSEKASAIEKHVESILGILGLDLKSDSLQRTPQRVAKMLVSELFQGLDSSSFPKITVQRNDFGYHEMLLECKINIQSMCEHHLMPIIGYCHIAYMPKDKVVGLSKLNRVAQYFARRPQVQERMTKQIMDCLVDVLENEDVAVVVDALHLCVRMRGIQDTGSLTRTQSFSGRFKEPALRREFLDAIPRLADLSI